MSNILKGLNEGYFSRDEENQQNAMNTRRSSDLSRERNAGLDEPDDTASAPVQTRNGVYEYTVPAGQESIAQELGLQQHRGHWISRMPIQRANFQFGRPQFHEIPAKGVAEGTPKDPNAPKLVQDRKTGKWYDPKKEFEKKMNSPEVQAQMKRMATKEGKEDKIAQLKKDHATAVHWSKNETSPQKREAARQKAEKIKGHLEKQYRQGVAEEQVDELSKDTLKSYVPKRIEKTKGLAKTDYDKAHRIIKKDIPRAMSKYKDPNYGKAQPTSPVDENKKGVRAVKHTTKPRNFVAKNAVATTSGAGAHKDKKKAMKQGETKHKGKEPAYESRLWAALERRIIK